MRNLSAGDNRNKPPHVDKLLQDFEVEYKKFNTGVFDTMKTEDLKKLQQEHFNNATQYIAASNMLLKHVSLISEVLLKRNLAGGK